MRKIDETQQRLSSEELKARQLQMQRTLALIVHAFTCGGCQSSSCRRVKQLWAHAFQCTVKASGGCMLCKRMWGLLQVHAKACTNPSCPVPRCRCVQRHSTVCSLPCILVLHFALNADGTVRKQRLSDG